MWLRAPKELLVVAVGRLFIKNGDPYGSCRNKVPPSPTFVFNVAEGYRVLRAKVEEHFESKIPGQWRADFAIYSKSANSAYQKDFQLIWSDSEALQTQLDTAWHKARLRNGGRAGFVLELYIYVPKPLEATTTLRRATAARSQEQTHRVDGLLREQGIPAGSATQSYMAVTQAWSPTRRSLTTRHFDSFSK
ncbi:hypothetical protein PC121_g12810 [Phytophthora cactorum]|nr:hypothetical protein PC120_g13760 [Phytophthora cactorum]KAG3061899.1 hypothetical protein PC121_g12810 [Phytophthora cactorum]KAG4052022.1 hypothetical protein PC123_g12782 [Phytophthora cactorum]